MWFLKLFRKLIGLFQDELIGGWYNGADDGSGFNEIWGYGLEFKSGGKGLHHHWGSDFDDIGIEKNLTRNDTFNWIRIDHKKIKIKFSDEQDDSWQEFEYIISDFTGAYEAKYYKIVKKGTENFWSSPGPLYKLKKTTFTQWL